MKRGTRTVGLILTASVLALCSACENPTSSPSQPAAAPNALSAEEVGEVLAEVNGMQVGTKEFDRTYARAMPSRPQDEVQDDNAKKQEVLDRLIADKLLYQEALRQGLDKDPKIQRMMINTLLRKDVYGTLRNSDISDEELQAYFEEHKDEFIVPEKVQVKRILIRISDETPEADARKKIDNILTEVRKDPDSFKDWAIKESQDPFARRGGDVGFISKSGKPGLDSKVVEEAFKLDAGQISDVFKTDDGLNIIQVVNKRDRVERSFEQMKGAVLRRLKTDKSRNLQENYVDNLKKNAKIVVNDEKLKAHEPDTKALPSMFPGSSLEGGPRPPAAAAKPLMPPGMRPPVKPHEEPGEEAEEGNESAD